MTGLRRRDVLLLFLLSAASLARAQLTSVPDLSTAVQLTTLESTGSTASSDGTATETTGTRNTDGTTTATSGATTDGTATTGTAAATTTFGSSSVSGLLTDAPTLAGVGIPTIGVPYTGDAPFMQKSYLPEGTVFIVVGAVLAFLGACVLLWRGLVAWSINRSVKKAALASVRGGEKVGSSWGGGSGYKPVKNSMYADNTYTASSMSLDNLTSQGKPIKPFKDDVSRSTPPSGLFFSPTEQALNSVAGMGQANTRASTHLPAGYYAAPSAHAAGGEDYTTIGQPTNPFTRNSYYQPSPPASPTLPQRRSNGGARTHASHGDRNSYLDNRHSYVERSSRPSTGGGTHLGVPASSSSAHPNQSGAYTNSDSSSNLAGSRAPSAYFEDLLENHGGGSRERY